MHFDRAVSAATIDDEGDRLVSLRAAAIRADKPATLVGAAAVATGQTTAVLVVGSRATPWLWAHSIAVVLILVAGLTMLWAESRQKPSDAALMHRWLPIARKIDIALNVAAIASPWVWLPLATPLFAGVLYLLFAWYLGVLAIFSRDDQGDARVGLIGLPLSLAGYELLHRTPLAGPIAIVFVAVGISLTFFERRRRRLQTEELHQRMAVERSASDLLARLATLAQHRPPPSADRSTRAEVKEPLTLRQMEVLRQVAKGLSNKEIARELGISPATVKVHVAQILATTQTTNRTAAAVTMLRQSQSAGVD